VGLFRGHRRPFQLKSETISLDHDVPGNLTILQHFVTDILNEHQGDNIGLYVTPSYRDHHPFRVPGVLEPLVPGFGTVRDVRAMVDFLSLPAVDCWFSLEDAFTSDDRIGYRLFGEGTVEVSRLSRALESRSGPQSRNNEMRHLTAPGTSTVLSTLGSPDGQFVGNRFHITYSCVGVYHVRSGRLAERWGPVLLG
jgi:hypothetical protein